MWNCRDNYYLNSIVVAKIDYRGVIMMKNLRQELIRQKYWQVWNRTQSDPEYARMFAEMAHMEARFEAVMEQLPHEKQDIIRDFVMHCEDMSRRMLECACEELVFPPPL